MTQKFGLQMVQDTLMILPSDLYVDHSVHPTLSEGCFKRKKCAVFLKCTFLDCFYDKGAEEIFDIHAVKRKYMNVQSPNLQRHSLRHMNLLWKLEGLAQGFLLFKWYRCAMEMSRF